MTPKAVGIESQDQSLLYRDVNVKRGLGIINRSGSSRRQYNTWKYKGNRTIHSERKQWGISAEPKQALVAQTPKSMHTPRP